MVVTAVGELQPAETEAVLARVQGGEQSGLFGDHDISLQPGLETGPGVAQCAPYGAFGLFAQVVEAVVQLRDELLLILEFRG